MKLPIYQVDAFSGRLFGGNPAAVVPLEKFLRDEVMQAIAAENNVSETAFPVRDGDGYRLRWFTPALEVDLCGHATLATAFVLFETGAVTGDSIRFETRSGDLTVTREGDLLGMDFPARPPSPAPCTDDLVAALDAWPAEVMVSRDLMAVFDDEDTVRGMSPDMGKIEALEAFAVIVTAPGRECDFVSRFFVPKAGIPEDPVTGSAHCTLVPYWAERLGRTELRALQVSRRGGELLCEHRGDRVFLQGRAVLYLSGEIEID
jgi:PhzF family phenazine biosynthesis protein